MVGTLEAKARLVLGGDVSLPEGFDDPLIDHRDGRPYSLVLSFDGCMVRKRISPDGQFSLVEEGGILSLEDSGKPFLEDVGIVRMFGHSPTTITVSIAKGGKVLSTEEALAIADGYSEMEPLKGVTIHGGSPCTIGHYAEVVRAYRERYPDLPIGVGSEDLGSAAIRILKDAGATNIKVTVKDRSNLVDLWDRFGDAVSVFGRGMVVCTMYIGQSATDASLLDDAERLCSIGVMPDLKVRKTAEGGRKDVPLDRYMAILERSKESMRRHGLDGSGFDTLCYGCRLCTIIPFKDFRGR